MKISKSNLFEIVPKDKLQVKATFTYYCLLLNEKNFKIGIWH